MGKLERLQKIISAAGIAARRKAETMILEGRVSVNGRIVRELGTRADPERDSIRVDGKRIRQPSSRLYLLLNKPRHVVCTLSDPEGRTKVTDLVNVRGRVYPVGRLDYETEGLILLTNDGAFAKIVGSAGDRFPKVYDVKVKPVPSEKSLDRLRAGLHLRKGMRLARCRIGRQRPGDSAWLEVTLTEGKNRQIRRMFEEIGCRVTKLRRKRIGFLTDDKLPVGSYRMLTPREVAEICRLGSSGAQCPGGQKAIRKDRGSVAEAPMNCGSDPLSTESQTAGPGSPHHDTHSRPRFGSYRGNRQKCGHRCGNPAKPLMESDR